MAQFSRTSEKIDVAVLGATGSVGQRYIEMLADHPQFHLAELVGSERSAGKRYADIADWRISAAPPEDAGNMLIKHHEEPLNSPIVFCSLPGGIAMEVEQKLASDGHAVFSNARDNRMETDVPLLIPEVNPDHARVIDAQRERRGWRDGFIVTNPNCSTIHLVLALKPIWDAFGIEQCMVTTMQASSGAGYPGVPSLDLIDNVVPHIGGEEEKMEIESRKLLGGYDGAEFRYADMGISAQCNRVPVRHGHTETVNLKLRRKASPSEVIDALRAFRGRPQELGLHTAPASPIIVRDQHDRPQPALDRDVAGGMASIVGRVRECSLFDIKFVVLGHNTIRGAAGASILNAELMLADGYIRA
ncbi:MAG TPA: aspartate-semialdehyde dehydrogenase [Thermomicrobiales bacterium]|nr:aspartate-semialdehyde dehydrogenase [Thermomicrobiales bacterium]